MKMKRFFKIILSCLLLASVTTLAVSCENDKNKIDEVRLVASSVPNSMLIDEVDTKLTTIQIKVTKGGESETINITKEMISDADLAKLDTAGTHLVTISYEGFEVKINLVITAPVAPVEGDEITYTDEVLVANLKTLTELPAAYDLYVWVWGTSVEGSFVPAADGKFNVPTGCTSAVFLIMPVGSQPNWDDKLDQTGDLVIVDGAVGVPVAGETTEFTTTLADIEANLKPDKPMPTVEYDLYVFTWGGTINGFTKISDDFKFSIDSGSAGGLFAFVTKGAEADWANVLAQTYDYSICWNASAQAFMFCGTDVTAVLTDVTGSLTDVPAEYDLYAWVWGGTPASLFAPVTVNADGSITFKAPVGTSGCTFVLMAKGEKAHWDTKLNQTGNFDIADGSMTPEAA